LIVFSSAFVFNGCTGTGEVNIDPAPWGDIVPGSGSPSLDTDMPSADYNDTVTNGQPIEGAYFIHPDHLGSVALVTDASGAVVSKVTYKPYGEVLRKDPGGNPVSKGPDFLRYKYTGQEDDPETGLMYYDARYYDPGLGRFITKDTIIPDIGSQGFNRYMYVGGNPVNRIDPSGNFWWLIIPVVIAIIHHNTGGGGGGGGSSGFLGVSWEDIGKGLVTVLAVAASIAVGVATAGAGFVVSGMIAGATGGLVSGLGNAWVNGDSAEEAFHAGMRGMAIGGITGAQIANNVGPTIAQRTISAVVAGGSTATTIALNQPPAKEAPMTPAERINAIKKIINNLDIHTGSHGRIGDIYWDNLKALNSLNKGLESYRFPATIVDKNGTRVTIETFHYNLSAFISNSSFQLNLLGKEYNRQLEIGGGNPNDTYDRIRKRIRQMQVVINSF